MSRQAPASFILFVIVLWWKLRKQLNMKGFSNWHQSQQHAINARLLPTLRILQPGCVPPQINTTEKKNKKTVRKQRTLSFSLKNNTGKSEKMGSLKAVTAQTFPKNQTWRADTGWESPRSCIHEASLFFGLCLKPLRFHEQQCCHY